MHVINAEWSHVMRTPDVIHIFYYFLQKLIYFHLRTHSFHCFYSFRSSICLANLLTAVPSALMHSMPPIANQSHALSTHVAKPPAATAIKLSFLAMMSPFQSAYSATLNSLILNFNTSALQSPSSLATSQNINKTSYSLKNKPCFLPLKPRSPMTNLLPLLILKSRMFMLKSRHSSPSKMISRTLADNWPHNLTLSFLLNLSFIAALIPIAMDSSLPLGNVAYATSSHARIAGNSNTPEMTTTMSAILTLSLLSHFSRLTLNLALIAKFLFTKPKDATKCSALSANAFGHGTPANLKLADTILTTCNGCARTMPAACPENPAKYCVDAKLTLNSLFYFIAIWSIFNTHSWLANNGIMTLLNTSAPSSPCSLPSLICAFMNFNASPLTALISILTLARLSLPTLSHSQNSSKPFFAIIYSLKKMNTFHKSFMLSFKLPLISLSAFYAKHKHLTQNHLLIGLTFHMTSHKNFSTSNLMLTTNFPSFMLTFTPLLPKYYSSIRSTSNLSTFLNLILFLILIHCSTLSNPSFADNYLLRISDYGKFHQVIQKKHFFFPPPFGPRVLCDDYHLP